MASESICSYNKFGHCKYKETCMYRHEKTKCEKVNCEIEKCSHRHPRDCRFFLQFGRCKFGDYCSFNHSILNKAEEKSIKALENNFENFKEEVLSTLEQQLNEKDTFKERIFNILEKQNEAINAMLIKMNEKDEKMFDLENQVKEIKETVSKLNLTCNTVMQLQRPFLGDVQDELTSIPKL